MKKYFAAATLVAVILGLAAFKLSSQPSAVAAEHGDTTPQPLVAASADTPKELPPMQNPRRLIIPSLNISSTILPVGRGANNEMALPDSLADSGWYKYGAAPGNPGKAVIAAHTGYPDQPSQFRNLVTLKPKDTFAVIDEVGTTAHFEVINQSTYRPNEAPLDSIFGDSPTPRLSLITCVGQWHAASNSYSHRLVIFAVRYK